MDKRTFYAQASGGADLHGQHQIVAEESPNTVALVYDQVDSNGRATAQEIARRWNAHPKLVEALRQAIVCVETGADDSEEAGYPSRAESMREDAAAYRAILNELNP